MLLFSPEVLAQTFNLNKQIKGFGQVSNQINSIGQDKKGLVCDANSPEHVTHFVKKQSQIDTIHSNSDGICAIKAGKIDCVYKSERPISTHQIPPQSKLEKLFKNNVLLNAGQSFNFWTFLNLKNGLITFGKNPYLATYANHSFCYADEFDVHCTENDQFFHKKLDNPTQLISSQSKACALDRKKIKCWNLQDNSEIITLPIRSLEKNVKITFASESRVCYTKGNDIRCVNF